MNPTSVVLSGKIPNPTSVVLEKHRDPTRLNKGLSNPTSKRRIIWSADIADSMDEIKLFQKLH